MKLNYIVEGNHICLSNGTKEKHLEWIHSGLLRVYENKNSEELVKLNYFLLDFPLYKTTKKQEPTS